MTDPVKIVEAPATVIAPVDTSVRVSDSLSPATTEEQDRKTLGQREINLMWERTQMRIALSVIWAALAVSVILSIMGRWIAPAEVQMGGMVFLYGAANLVTGFYFGRTNHTRSSSGEGTR